VIYRNNTSKIKIDIILLRVVKLTLIKILKCSFAIVNDIIDISCYFNCYFYYCKAFSMFNGLMFVITK